jgi:hypothetical protein
MTVKVGLEELADRIAEYDFAYLVSVGETGAHVIAVTPAWHPDGIVVGALGRHSLANAAAHPAVTLVWPPAVQGGYSLIVDGTATVSGDAVTVSPTKAVLHRPAPGADGARAGNDCQPIELPSSEA